MVDVVTLDRIIIRFAGDSGDGMQLTGDRFTAETAHQGNDLATLPSYPAEIRAPQGTVPGVSSFQIQFADHDISTPGDRPDVLVAMNPAALKAHLPDLADGGIIVVDAGEFTSRALTKAGYSSDPLTDGSLQGRAVVAPDLTALTVAAVADLGVTRKEATRSKNMFALGLVTWLYSRPTAPTEDYLTRRFAQQPAVRDANLAAFRAGHAFGETSELFAHRYEIAAAPMPPGVYRHINGNQAMAYGLMTGAHLAGLGLVCGTYPITPASDILHELARHKNHGVTTVQAEDEIAGVGVALGASFAGALGVTTTSGPGLALKTETINLAVMTELPLVVVDVQRAGPSTGLPTKTEQADLFAALVGRPGESPVPVLAPGTPAECFDVAVEACRIAVTYRTPVIVLSDGYLGNGAEPWQVPRVEDMAPIDPAFETEPNGVSASGAPRHLPYRRDPQTLARAWAVPGTPGLEHRIGGLEKSESGAISYDPDNHETMVRVRAAKIAGVPVADLTVDDPSGRADVLVLGWGSTAGPIRAGADLLRQGGHEVATAHLRHLNPLPANLAEVLERYDRVVVPELNLGQLALTLRAVFSARVTSLSQVRGMPLTAHDVADFVANLEMESDSSPHETSATGRTAA
ncbi:MAG: 2-oxoacid:acceptor oxidoreductase subunit alpha [Propionibacteriaceae bacterium]|nr:2-oxoacid:acceptor oxidoreductase subunit alpha [Propionibacteriaceae bacterium]